MFFIAFSTVQWTKSQKTVKTRDVTRWKSAHTSSEPAGCLGPVYFFHDNSVESFRRDGRLNVIQQEALHCLRWVVIPEQAWEDNWTYKRSDLHQLKWAVHYKESLLWQEVLKKIKEGLFFLWEKNLQAFGLVGLYESVYLTNQLV